MKIIDPHLHLFNLEQGDYHWLKKETPPFWPDKQIINRSFNEEDLKVNSPNELAGFVHIEAGFDNENPWQEIAWLESHCKLPFRSVAAIDLTLDENAFIQQIDKLLPYTSVVGCRHILDEQAHQILQQQSVQNNLAHLASKQLSFDLQMSLVDERSLALLAKILTDIPSLRVIIDHAGLPSNQSATAIKNWQVGLKTLSQFKHCAIKCSGWEMIDRDYSFDWLAMIINSCIDSFGDKRVMFASNFPLVLFSQSYQSLWKTYQELNITKEQLTALTYDNAVNWYRLTV